MLVQLTCVTEHAYNLVLEIGDNSAVEEGVKTCEDNTANYYRDDDLDTCVNVALRAL